jgi:hypothetical protein
VRFRYEILSEPRDKNVSVQAVRSLYAGGCAATRVVDPRTPCMVGAAPFYKLWTFRETYGSVALPGLADAVICAHTRTRKPPGAF